MGNERDPEGVDNDRVGNLAERRVEEVLRVAEVLAGRDELLAPPAALIVGDHGGQLDEQPDRLGEDRLAAPAPSRWRRGRWRPAHAAPARHGRTPPAAPRWAAHRALTVPQQAGDLLDKSRAPLGDRRGRTAHLRGDIPIRRPLTTGQHDPERTTSTCDDLRRLVHLINCSRSSSVRISSALGHPVRAIRHPTTCRTNFRRRTLAARPMFVRTRDANEAHQTIVSPHSPSRARFRLAPACPSARSPVTLAPALSDHPGQRYHPDHPAPTASHPRRPHDGEISGTRQMTELRC